MTEHTNPRRMPALFVSHGAPTLAVEDGPAHRFLAGLGDELTECFDKPRAVLMISAHYEAPAPTVTASPSPETIHDFGGFPRKLYDIHYPAPGDPALAAEVVELLQAAGWPARSDPDRGLDHGAWVPLRLMYPDADVPVVQVSIDSRRGPAYHYELGKLLRPLRDKGVLIIGSGGATHNLRLVFESPHDGPPPDWVKAFGEWVNEAVTAGRYEDLIEYRARGPEAANNHPTEEHFVPLLTALGTAGPDETRQRIHSSHTYGALMMDMYWFGSAPAERAARN